MMFLLMIFAFFLGAVTILALEAVGVVILIRWLNKKVEKEEAKSMENLVVSDLDPSFYNKQGFVWVLESEKVPKGWPLDKASKDQKLKKDIFEVTPVRKHARIKEHRLTLTEPDNSLSIISLKGCITEAVSASALPSRKWAKRFPIKLENKVSNIYKGSRTLYIYLDTSWEKESWCKALRLASGDDKEQLKWFAKLNHEFHNYLTSLNNEYPSFMKPSFGIHTDPHDKTIIKMDNNGSSKVRQFLKKLKKATKSGPEVKSSSSSMSSHDEKNRLIHKAYSFDEQSLGTKIANTEDSVLPPSLTSSASGRSQVSIISDRDSEDKFSADEGSLCWNLLISRLFFDAKNNAQMKNTLQSRIQRTLSSMRTPSYIGEITCTSLDLGNLPPYIHGMRVLPSDMNEKWGMEIDVEYAGGVLLNIETRLEIHEFENQQGEDKNLESNSMGEVASDLIEGIENYGKQFKDSENTPNEIHQKDENKSCNNKITTRVSSQVSRWKSILHSVAKQVSQVPISLGIEVTYLRGTLRLYIKSPPSDQIWFGFTSMPHIDFNLKSSVGDHKVTSGHIALYLISRFKTAIRETLVLPNCESALVPWMLAEENDWAPRNVAPFIFINQENAANNSTKQEESGSQSGKVSSTVDVKETPTTVASEPPVAVQATFPATIPVDSKVSKDVESLDVQSSKDDLLEDVRIPFLKNDEPPELLGKISEERNVNVNVNVNENARSRSPSIGEQSPSRDEDDPRSLKRIGTTKARMLSLRKKMGDKIEEKRRNLEEKGRNMVEKMRENRN